MGTRMQQRRGTTAQWVTANPILADGELGLDRDTGALKIGDGVTAWADLQHSYLLATGKANDSNLLDGIESSEFALKTDSVNPNGDSTFHGTVTFGDSDTDVTFQRAAVVETHVRSTTLSYTGLNLTTVIEKAGVTVVRNTTLTYDSKGKLTTTVEVSGGLTITTNLTYDINGNLTGTIRTVA